MSNKNITIEDIRHYLELPYTVILKPDEDGDFVARIMELPGCSAHGSTQAEALVNLRESQQLWIQDAIESGDTVPVPEAEEDLPSGKWVQRCARTLHKKLSGRAKREEVSLNQLVATILAESMGENTTMCRMIDESLVAQFAGHRGAHIVTGKHLDALWPQQGNWLIEGARPTSTGVTRHFAGIANMLAPKEHIYNDDEKETTDRWTTTVRH
jgi:antitoxin HicB